VRSNAAAWACANAAATQHQFGQEFERFAQVFLTTVKTLGVNERKVRPSGAPTIHDSGVPRVTTCGRFAGWRAILVASALLHAIVEHLSMMAPAGGRAESRGLQIRPTSGDSLVAASFDGFVSRIYGTNRLPVLNAWQL
jgi:hypothetical protein